jgi:hypothetical protein
MYQHVTVRLDDELFFAIMRNSILLPTVLLFVGNGATGIDTISTHITCAPPT